VETRATYSIHQIEEEQTEQLMNSKSKYCASYPSPMYTIHTITTADYAFLGNQRTYSHTHTHTDSFIFISSNLLTLELVLLDGESHLEQVLLLLHVGGLETSGDGGTGVAASVHDVLPVVVLGVVE